MKTDGGRIRPGSSPVLSEDTPCKRSPKQVIMRDRYSLLREVGRERRGRSVCGKRSFLERSTL